MVTDGVMGLQVAYIPSHADGDVTHPDVEFGFIMTKSPSMDAYFVRYWTKGKAGIQLRTTANSELTYAEMLMPWKCCDQEIVDAWIRDFMWCAVILSKDTIKVYDGKEVVYFTVYNLPGDARGKMSMVLHHN